MKKKKLFLLVLILAILALVVFTFFTGWLLLENAAYQNALQTVDTEKMQLEADLQETYTAYYQQSEFFSNLQEEHTKLNHSYIGLLRENAELEREKQELGEIYTEVSELRLPHEIPTSSVVSGLDLLLTPQALLFNYPGLYVVSGENTTSMHPTISVGHVALVSREFDPYEMKVGDIVAYESSRSDVPIAHRIIEVEGEGNGVCYRLQGDNNPYPDQGCANPSDILYRIVGVLYGANPQGFQNCPEGYAGIAIDNKLECISETIPAGVYLTDQPVDQGEGYPLCADTQPNARYTVVTPAGRVYCEDR